MVELLLVCTILGAAESSENFESTRNRKNLFSLLRLQSPWPSDWILTSRYRSLLAQDPELASHSIRIHSKKGTIILRGTVDSPEIRARAERLAHEIDGVKSVDNELFVQAPILVDDPGVRFSSHQGPVIAQSARSFEELPGSPDRNTNFLAVPRRQVAHTSSEFTVHRPFSTSRYSLTNVREQEQLAFWRLELPRVVTYLVDQVDDPSDSRLAFRAQGGPQERLRADIEVLFRRDHRARRLSYRLQHGELTLSGEIGSSSDLYDLTAMLGELRGVELIGFENLIIGGW